MQLLFKYLYLHLIEPECAESIDTKDQLSIVSWGWMKSSCGRKEHNHITEKRSQGGPVLTVIFGQVGEGFGTGRIGCQNCRAKLKTSEGHG